MTEGNSTLTKNAIKRFILRLDFGSLDEDMVNQVAEIMRPNFNRIEKRIVQGIKFEINAEKTKVENQNAHDTVCISETSGISLIFSGANGSVSFETTSYKNKDSYADTLKSLIAAFEAVGFQGNARRIGMRFINEFSCDNKANIGKIYAKRISTIVRGLLKGEDTSRVIAMEETTTSEYKSRTQYGIANKYYPEKIRVYDLLLDVDMYIDTPTSFSEFGEAAKTLNKAAYKIFIACMNEKYLEKLK